MPKAKKVKRTGMQQISELLPDGREKPDPTPMSAALGKRRAKSIRDNVVEILRSEKWREAMEENGEETFEEADDFDVDDDFDPSTPYEEFFEGEYAYLRSQRLEEAKTETKKARRGRQAAPRDAEKSGIEPAKANAPEPAPTVPQDGPART